MGEYKWQDILVEQQGYIVIYSELEKYMVDQQKHISKLKEINGKCISKNIEKCIVKCRNILVKYRNEMERNIQKYIETENQVCPPHI